MTIYSGPVFDMARQQFQVIADHLEIVISVTACSTLKRAIVVSCPIHPTTAGWPSIRSIRVQHHLTLTHQGGHTVFVERRYWRGCGSGNLDQLEMCPRWVCRMAAPG